MSKLTKVAVGYALLLLFIGYYPLVFNLLSTNSSIDSESLPFTAVILTISSIFILQLASRKPLAYLRWWFDGELVIREGLRGWWRKRPR
ncbi:MAG: hypothetical protein KGI38_11720 [Thaumarchaeota archaeon]|nr:hypothetical protein [Nitrososphaerota archaeon]